MHGMFVGLIIQIDFQQLYKTPMFEIKSQHQHTDFDCHPRKDIQNELEKVDIVPLQPIPQKRKIRKIRIKSLPGEDPNQYYIADSLIPLLQQSMTLIPSVDFEVISTRRKNLQLYVYTSLVEDGKDYLARLFKTNKTNQIYVHDMISQTVFNVNDAIMNQILQGEHDVHRIARPTKNDIYGNRTTEAAIRIRQQMLKAKISDLKSDINNSNIHASPSNQSQFLNLNSADLYSEDSVKTQRAKEFVRRMQEMQEQQRRERQQKEQYKRQKKLEEELEKKQLETRLKQERHEYLQKQYQKKRQEKEKQKQIRQSKNAQFKTFLDEFKGKTPLFKQKQKQFFEKFIVPENKKKLEILKQIRQDRKPLSHEDLIQHEKQYLQIKQDHVYEKNAARAVQSKSKKPDKNYYKSKFHSLIEKQQKQREEMVDENEIRAQAQTKRFDYANEVKTRFVPKVDFKKREEMAKNIQELSWLQKVRVNRSVNIETYKKDGKDNLEKLHKFIAEHRAKGRIKSIDASRTAQTSPNSSKIRYKNYLHELREAGTTVQARTSRTRSIDYATIISTNQDAQRFKLDLRKKEEITSRREQYVANLGSRNLEKYLEEKKKLDDDYLEAVKAKMAVINKFQ